MRRLARLRTLVATIAATAVLAGCTGEVVLTADPPTDVTTGAVTQEPPEGVTVLEGEGATALAIASSQAYFDSAEIVVITPPEAGAQLRAASVATTLGLPVLVTGEEGTADAVAAELERLGTRTVLVTSEATVPELSPDRPFLRAVPAPDDLDGLQVVIGRDLAGEVVVQPGGEVAALAAAQEPFDWLLVPPSAATASSDTTEPSDEPTRNLADLPGLPPFRAPERLSANALVADGGEGQIAAVGTARAAGAGVVVTSDVASDPNAIASLFGLGAQHIVGVGDLGDPATFAYRARVAATGVDLPGGGQELLEGKAYVGLRGAPGAPELGSLGAQDTSATLERLRSLATTAGEGSASTVVPTAVLLTTVASSSPGTDGSYSGKRTLADVEAFVDAARDAGISVLLAFQPGRQSMLEQVALYDEVLARPNVGVALEPGWRLRPGEVPGSQAGVVAAEEVNAVVTHLAALTDQQALPPKMLLVRLATDTTVSDPENIDDSRPQVGVVLEVNGGAVTPPAAADEVAADPAAPAPSAVTAQDVWARATALPWNGSWGWAQGATEVAASELFALTPPPAVITYP